MFLVQKMTPKLVVMHSRKKLQVHFTGIHRVYVPKKKKKKIVFFNNRDIASFIERCCGKGTAIENEAIREAMKETEQ